MVSWQQVYLLVFLLGSGLTLILTPAFKKLAEKTGVMDRPKGEKHKRHDKETPLLGGAAMFSAWTLAIGGGILMLFSADLQNISSEVAANLEGVKLVSGRLIIIIIGALAATMLGLWDDKYGMDAIWKLLGQILIAAFVVSLSGIKITLFCNNPVFVWGISVFWFVLLMNAFNFFDNMDGLAVGTSTIAMALFAVVAALSNQYFLAALGALTCGVGLGFWFYNHTPASIFMGDSGSHFLGYMAAVMSASITYFSREYSLTRLPILLPFFILAIPLFDTLAVVVIRLRNGKPIYIGDHNHISHRFVKMGLSRRRAVQLVHLLVLALGLNVLPLLWGEFKTSIVITVQAMLLILIVTIMQVGAADFIKKEKVKNDQGTEK